MSTTSTHKAYRFYKTADGSPTLEFSYDSGALESMHNSQGAFAESIYIYGHALEMGLSWPSPRVLSVGLGLGYNEFLTAAYALKKDLSADQILLASYENEEFLKAHLLAFLKGDSLPKDFAEAYEWILNACSEKFELSAKDIMYFLISAFEQKRWSLEGAFDPLNLESEKSWNVFLYDAFSSKTNPNLWSEEGLTALLLNHAGNPSCFSTYAATGALKRALKTAQFDLVERAGFSGKRQSTFATKTKGS